MENFCTILLFFSAEAMTLITAAEGAFLCLPVHPRGHFSPLFTFVFGVSTYMCATNPRPFPPVCVLARGGVGPGEPLKKSAHHHQNGPDSLPAPLLFGNGATLHFSERKSE